MSRNLFRQEAIDAQREKYLGETTLARPVAYWVYTLLAASIADLILGSEYARSIRCVHCAALVTLVHLRPAIPNVISPIEATLSSETGSLSSVMPTMAMHAAPHPAHKP